MLIRATIIDCSNYDFSLLRSKPAYIFSSSHIPNVHSIVKPLFKIYFTVFVPKLFRKHGFVYVGRGGLEIDRKESLFFLVVVWEYEVNNRLLYNIAKFFVVVNGIHKLFIEFWHEMETIIVISNDIWNIMSI